jgi:hypothetical protein
MDEKEEIKKRLAEIRQKIWKAKEEQRRLAPIILNIRNGRYSNEVIKNEIQEIVKKIKSHPLYHRLKPLLSRDLKEPNSKDTKPSLFEQEIYSLACEIFAEENAQLRRTAENPHSFTRIPLEKLIENKITENINNNEEKIKDLLSRQAGEISERYIKANKACEKFNISYDLIIPSISKEDRFLNKFIDSLKQSDLYRLSFITPGKKRKEIGKDRYEFLKNCKAVYEIAKEKNIDRRKLLYTLKKIKFPLFNLYDNKNKKLVYVPLFESIYHTLKAIWAYEENYKKWIEYFKKKGWSKSRVSHFINRAVKDGKIPSVFFEVKSPSPENLLLLESIKSKTKESRPFKGISSLREALINSLSSAFSK